MTSDAGDDAVLTELSARPTVRGRWRFAVLSVVITCTVWLLATGLERDWFTLLTLLACSWSYLMPTTSVTAQGIRRPWPQKLRWISWGDVEVVESDSIQNRAVLVLVDGSRIALGFAASRASEIAKLGDRPLRQSVPPKLPAMPVPPRVDEEKALRARAAALAAENARMTAELARLRRRPGT